MVIAKRYAFLLGLVALLLFSLYSYLVKEDYFISFDFDNTVKIQNYIPKTLDGFLSVLSLLGSFETTIILLFFVLLYLLKVHTSWRILNVFLGKKLHKSTIVSWVKTHFSLLAVFLLFIFAHLIELIGKSFVDHPGPPFMFFRYNIDFLFPTSYVPYHAGIEGSYPSGHSLRIVFLAVVFVSGIFASRISRFLKTLLSTIILLTTFTMLLSRISLGEHWTSDVIGGSLLGLGFGLLSLIFL